MEEDKAWADKILREHLMSFTVCLCTKSSQKIFAISRVVGHFAYQGHIINITGEEKITKIWL